MTALVHAPAFSNAFLDFDDPAKILQNESIRAITAHNVATSFTTPVIGMYSPLENLSYAVDYRIGGLDVTPYHATNLVLHLLNVSLVCVIVLALTGSSVSATVVTALFAVHPVQVAAVAPLNVRSSLLYSCFYLAAWLAYVAYLRKETRPRLALSFGLFVLALLSKSAAVVLPLLLLLTDYYVRRAITRRVVLEKVPFLLASAVVGGLALTFRPDMAAMRGSVLDYSLVERACLAAYSLVFYLRTLLVPVGLSAFYPYLSRVGGHLPAIVYAAPLAVPAIAWLAARRDAHRRLVVFGGAFFVLHLVLVLKIVPLGLEFVADRYLYIASLGLFLVVAEWCRQSSRTIRRAGLAGFAVIVLWCLAGAYARNADWKDSITFYTRVLERYPNSAVAHNNLGGALEAVHRSAEALGHYQAAVRLEPGYVRPHVNLGNALVDQGRAAEAVPEFMTALRLEPANAKARAGLGDAFARLDRTNEAIAELTESIRLDPTVVETHNNLGVLLDRQGRTADAIAQYTAALALDPGWVDAHNNLGAALATEGRIDDAGAQFTEAVRLDPNSVDAHRNLGLARAQQGRVGEAIHEFQEVLRLAPADPAARRLLAQLTGR